MRLPFLLATCLTLSACGLSGQDNDRDTAQQTARESDSDLGYDAFGDDNLADSMASNDTGSDAETIPDSEERPIMQAQVVLDREGFGPGIIDGKMGMSTENALRGYQEANDLEVTGKLDEATKKALSQFDNIRATRVVTIPARFAEAEYYDIPEEPEAIAELERMGYKTLDERLAERFHTTVEVLRELNPGGRPAGADGSASGAARATPSPTPSASRSSSPTPTPSATASGSARASNDTDSESMFRPGQQLRVPNIGGDRIAPGSIDDRAWQQTLASLGVGSEQPTVDRVVVSKSDSTLRAYDGDELIALFTVTSGSSQFPLPLGNWDIVGEAYNPPYSYDPAVLSGGKEDGETYTFPPGPNSPVGIVWIDLSKEHYGIHGTPDPETIGRAQSSGCVRLTNWDAARLAQMVSTQTAVEFVA